MDRLAIGVIRASHGVKGNVKVKSLSGETDHFLRLKKVYLRQGEDFIPLAVRWVQKTASAILMKLEGIDSPEEARKYQGLELWVSREDACPLAPGEYYLADICGCRVYQQDREIGRVKAVCDGGASDILEVVGPEGKIIMVPLVEPFVGEIDIEGQRILLKEDFVIP